MCCSVLPWRSRSCRRARQGGDVQQEKKEEKKRGALQVCRPSECHYSFEIMFTHIVTPYTPRLLMHEVTLCSLQLAFRKLASPATKLASQKPAVHSLPISPSRPRSFCCSSVRALLLFLSRVYARPCVYVSIYLCLYIYIYIYISLKSFAFPKLWRNFDGWALPFTQ